MKDSVAFEQLIAQIHRLLHREDPAVSVQWNEKIVDPDNPSQLRQIDILIKREEVVTHVECRIHEGRQDVMWIEELYGRKHSLNADFIIAVSSSGFTKGAILKAKKLGVVLKDLRSLSAEEVVLWGKSSKVVAHYIEFNDPSIIIIMDGDSPEVEVSEEQVHEFLNTHTFDVFNYLSTWYEGLKDGVMYDLYYDYIMQKEVRLNGKIVLGGKVSLKNAKKTYKESKLSTATFFGSPEEDVFERDAVVQNFDGTNWQLISNLDKEFFLQLDISCEY